MCRMRSIDKIRAFFPLAHGGLCDTVTLCKACNRLKADGHLGAHRRGGAHILVQGDPHVGILSAILALA
jgi:hypothetical protein